MKRTRRLKNKITFIREFIRGIGLTFKDRRGLVNKDFI